MTQNSAIKRLMFDLEELQRSPVENVSAAPLDDNMFEWHCNIRQNGIIFHLILFFPKNYPYASPSAEFVPSGFQYNSGATKPGKKGTKICLNIFADFADVHTEWENEKGLGWSPGYTVQMILMNVVAFLAETQTSDSSDYSYNHNLKMSEDFKCDDCGHDYKTPVPSLDFVYAAKAVVISGKGGKGKVGKGKKGKTGAHAAATTSKKTIQVIDSTTDIIDYISRDKFQVQKPSGTDDLFGYGLAVGGTGWRPLLTSPCEFISGRSFFGMKKSMNVVHSVMKEELRMFLPLYIHPLHGADIQTEVEKTLQEVATIMPKYDPKTSTYSELILKLLPNLMSATVVEFSKGTQHTSDNSLNGYFALHRLLLWATDAYPDLQEKIETQVREYVENEKNRTKSKVPYIAEWLMLVAASKKFRWQDVADAYLSESWKRNVIWYVKADGKLGFLDTPQDYRIRRTFEETEIARKHLAFQVRFLDIAMPSGMTRQQVIKRYDSNLGFPTEEMVKELKQAFVHINSEMTTFQDWFKILKIPVIDDAELHKVLVEAVRFSIITPGYHWTSAKTGGGWGQVMEKYAEMRKAAKGEYQKQKAANEGAECSKDSKEVKGKTKAADGDEANDVVGKGSKGKTATRGTARGRGRANSSGRGMKRKASVSSSDDNDDESAGNGRGRGRGRAAKRGKR